MSDKPVRIKRNLNQLLSSVNLSSLTKKEEPLNSSELRYIALEKIQRGKYQPRKNMNPEALEELANSIKTQGVLQPIVLRPINDHTYEIIAGERRWRAAQLAGLNVIPAIIKEVSDEITMALALIENIQRENLNPIEESMAMQRLIDECGLTHQQVADELGKPRTTVSNLLRLASLAAEFKTLVESGDINLGHAKVLLALEENIQVQAARQIALKQLSVRETEKLVQRLLAEESTMPQRKHIDPNIMALQRNIADKLGASVNIEHGNKGNGKLIIHYNDLEQLDGILNYFN